MFLHLARATVSQYTVTVWQRQAGRQAGHQQAEDPITFCWGGWETRLAPEALSWEGPGLWKWWWWWGGLRPIEAGQEGEA